MSVKRFSSNIHDDLNGIYNIPDNRMPLDHNEIVDLMNSLSHENEQLKHLIRTISIILKTKKVMRND